MKILTNEEEDHNRFFVPEGDPGFNPDRNKYTIKQSIKVHERNLEARKRDYDNELGERTSAVASYLEHLAHGKNTPVEKYFGKQTLTHLQGRKIRQRLIDASKQRYSLEEI